MRSIHVRLALLLFLLLSVASSAWPRDVYMHEPPFTPQRTLYWEFGSTWSVPYTAVGPVWDSQGWECDDVTWSQGLTWFDTSPLFPNRNGLIGIDNTNGTEAVTASVTFHINNFANQNPLKWVWFETEEQLTNGSIAISPGMPEGYEGSFMPEGITESIDGGWRQDLLYQITPNPDWEEVTFTFTAYPGGKAAIDNFYVSTLCTPEPSALLALGSGAMGLLGLAWRRRR